MDSHQNYPSSNLNLKTNQSGTDQATDAYASIFLHKIQKFSSPLNSPPSNVNDKMKRAVAVRTRNL
jgi:hypothetical protein